MERARVWRFAAILALTCGLGFPAGRAEGDTVTEWNEIMLDAIRTAGTAPPAASRGMAMVQAAVFDAVNGVTHDYHWYRVAGSAAAGTSAEAAAASAAHDVLAHLYPGQSGTFDAALANSLAGIPDGPGEAGGVALGQYVASEMIAWRSGDGSTGAGDYTVSGGVGEWRPTLPGYAPPLAPGWRYVAPFGVGSPSAFRPAGPPVLTSTEYAAAHEEVRLLGAVDSGTRTADETEVAQFWADGPGTATPPGHWNGIGQTVAAMQGYTLSENARLFGLLNVALADAAITAWDAKYEYDLWRPITAIREADSDGNGATVEDGAWLPLLDTPAFPEYVSGHSTFSGAAARVLALFVGDDVFSFSDSPEDMPGVTRYYTSFSEASVEAGRSRIYGGIHFASGDVDGASAGMGVADYVFTHCMTVPEPGSLVLMGLGVGWLVAGARKRR